MNTKNKRLIKDTIVFGAGNICSKLILFLLVPLYTNYLSTEEYGSAEMTTILVGLVAPFFSMCIHSALLRFSLSASENKKDVARMSMVICVLSSILAVAVTPLLELYPSVAPFKWYFPSLCIISTFHFCGFNYLKVAGMNRVYSLLGVIEAFVLAVVNIFLIRFLQLNATGYLIANIIASGLCAIVSLFMSKFFSDAREGVFDKLLAKRLLKYSFPLSFGNVIWWINLSFGNFALSISGMSEELGLYSAASKLSSLINLVIGVFSQSWGLSSIHEIEGEKDQAFFSRVFIWYSMAVTGMGIALIIVAKPFVYIFMGVEFRESWKYIPLLLTGTVFYAIEVYFESLYLALKKTMNSVLTCGIGAAVDVLLTIILIDYCGIWGAAIGYFVGFFVIVGIRVYDMDRYIRLDYSKIRYWVGIVVLIVAAVTMSIDFYGIWFCIAAMIVYLILYGRVWIQVLHGLHGLVVNRR